MKWPQLVLILWALQLGESQADERATLRPDPAMLSPQSAIIIEGYNPHPAPQSLLLRIDDSLRPSYRERLNKEYWVLPGDFSIRLPLHGLRASGGRVLRTDQIQQITAASLQSPLVIAPLKLTPDRTAETQAPAWDAGPESAPLANGFHALPNPPPSAQAFRRSGGDPLIDDGLRRLRQLTLPIPAGDWQLEWWWDDRGEWEFFPHPRWRELRLNGLRLHREEISPTEWYATRYLAGRDRESLSPQQAYDDTLGRRSRPLSARIHSDGRPALLELAGEGPGADVINGLRLQAAGTPPRPPADQAQRFAQEWPVLSPAPKAHGDALSIEASTPAENLRGAPGEWLFLRWELRSPRADKHPLLLVDPPTLQGTPWPSQLRFGHWRPIRPDAGAQWLALAPTHLRGDFEQLQLLEDHPRPIHLWLKIPANTPAGRYGGHLQLAAAGETRQWRFDIEVLPVQLPPAAAIGLYYEPSPFWAWFPGTRDQAQRQRGCDMQLLRSLGLGSIAPNLITPKDDAHQQQFIQELQQVVVAGYTAPQLAYTPFKRLLDAQGEAGSAARLAALLPALRQAGLPAPYWSAADETEPHLIPELQQRMQRLRMQIPDARWAAQLNRPEHDALLPLFDRVLLNHGYRLNAERMSEAAQQRELWLYNLPQPRLGAGFYRWRSGAKGYLQWHARMPTADPFDPTDGREGDVQLLMPPRHWNAYASGCEHIPDVDSGLEAMAEAARDSRWLQWLDQRAQTDLAARQLRQFLQDAVPTDWQSARTLQDATLNAWRSRIQALSHIHQPAPPTASAP